MMKKIIAIISIAALFTGCGFNSSNKEIVTIKHLDGTLEKIKNPRYVLYFRTYSVKICTSDGRVIETSVNNVEVIEGGEE